ncbi:hypothetical protein N7461_007440 [Penicillium sp. DV-2018c]|nr:hypothetical protein N7461_007440 [Penicillium sp. DV-2018c]
MPTLYLLDYWKDAKAADSVSLEAHSDASASTRQPKQRQVFDMVVEHFHEYLFARPDPLLLNIDGKAAINTIRNDAVTVFNDRLIARMPGRSRKYYSADRAQEGPGRDQATLT